MGPPGFDTRYGYGRVDAYNAVTGTQGPTMKIYVSAIDATTGEVVKTVAADANNSYKLDGLTRDRTTSSPDRMRTTIRSLDFPDAASAGRMVGRSRRR